MPNIQEKTAANTRKAASSWRSHAQKRRIARGLAVFLAIVLAFIGGFLVRSNVSLMTSLGIPMPEFTDSSKSANTVKLKTTYESLSMRISEAEDMLSAYSFDTVDLDSTTTQMLTTLMSATEDPYAAYFTEEQYQRYMSENSSAKFSGVGVLFGDYEGKAYVIDVLEGSQAQAEGVQQGDFVRAVDGSSNQKWSAADVIAAISKDDGSNVVITWMRPKSLDASSGDEFTTSLETHNYNVENVTSELSNDVGIIKVRQITSTTADLVENAVKSLAGQGAKAFVLDLSDNPGGFLTQSLDTASLFVPSGVLVGVKTVSGVNTRSASGMPITNAPLVVLVNNYTSGVSEVLAAALQDNQRATVVGQRTAGKGSIQVTRELTFGGAIRYTAGYYLTPLGHELNGAGVLPNVEVSPSDAEGQNIQLLVAVDIAHSMIK